MGSISEKIMPQIVHVNPKDIPQILPSIDVKYNVPLTAGNLSQYYINNSTEPYVIPFIIDPYFRGPYTIKKGDVTVASNIKLNKSDSFDGNQSIGSTDNVDKQIKGLINTSWWKWQAYYQQKYNAWREEWVRFC